MRRGSLSSSPQSVGPHSCHQGQSVTKRNPHNPVSYTTFVFHHNTDQSDLGADQHVRHPDKSSTQPVLGSSACTAYSFSNSREFKGHVLRARARVPSRRSTHHSCEGCSSTIDWCARDDKRPLQGTRPCSARPGGPTPLSLSLSTPASWTHSKYGILLRIIPL